MALSELFSEFTLRNHRFSNRIVMPPMATNRAEEDGGVTDFIIDHYRQRAEAGVGTIIVEHTYVRRDGRVNDLQMGAHEPGLDDGLAELAGIITGEGAAAIIQLTHAGASGLGDETGTVWGAGSVPLPGRDRRPQPLTDEGLRDIRRHFAEAAARCVQAGFDGVEIHGAHGYLLNQFLSPLTNDRRDEYGGDLAGRGRFPLEVVRAVREAMGDGPLLYYRLGADDLMQGGLSTCETGAFACQLVDAGVDVIDISGGLGGSRPDGAGHTEGYFLPQARAVKNQVRRRAPVILTGGIINACTAEELVSRGGMDFVGIGRALLSDPGWAAKAKARLVG